jgi:hypothetical protein
VRRMSLRLSRAALVCAAISPVAVLGLTACGGGGDGGSGKSATDAASGVTVTVADDQVKVKRSAKSTAGTAGTSATVSCTDDYAKLVRASAIPAPSQPWYATTLITWPGTSKESSARLSHGLDGDPQLCVVQTADQSASSVIYFDGKVKSAVAKLQADDGRKQQAAQASAALTAGAQGAVAKVSGGKFPDVDAVLAAVKAGGLQAAKAASLDAVTEAGTVYVVADKTTNKTVVLAVKDSKGKVQTATQGVKGSPKIAAAKG